MIRIRRKGGMNEKKKFKQVLESRDLQREARKDYKWSMIFAGL